jgi:hypothetical protein
MIGCSVKDFSRLIDVRARSFSLFDFQESAIPSSLPGEMLHLNSSAAPENRLLLHRLHSFLSQFNPDS